MVIDNTLFGQDPADISDSNTAARIGARIRKIRELQGLSQKELGDKVELSSDRIQQYENGYRRPRLELIKKIASALNVSSLALIDSTPSSHLNVMFNLFELRDNYGMKLEKKESDESYSLKIEKAPSALYDYLELWHSLYILVQKEASATSSEEEKKKIMNDFKLMEYSFPTGITFDKQKNLRKELLKNQIAKLQDELANLEDD